MKRIIVLLVFMFLVESTYAQKDTVTRYYNFNWEKTSKENAIYYRNAFKNDSNTWTVKDYFSISNKLQMSGTFTNKRFKKKNGFFTFYYPNGYKESEGAFVNNNKYRSVAQRCHQHTRTVSKTCARPLHEWYGGRTWKRLF